MQCPECACALGDKETECPRCGAPAAPPAPAHAPCIYSRAEGAAPAPPSAVYVGHPSPWENPFPMENEAARDRACDAFEFYAAMRLAQEPDWLDPLRGRDLVCWCQSPGDRRPRRCHAETLLRLANGPVQAGHASDRAA